MLEAAKSTVKMTNRILAFNLVKGLRRRRVGTHAIEKAAKILIEMEERDEGVVVKLLDIVIKSSETKMMMARKVAFCSSRKAKALLPAGWMRKRFRDILKQEVEPIWREKKTKHARKKDMLEARYKPRKEADEIRAGSDGYPLPYPTRTFFLLPVPYPEFFSKFQGSG